MTNYHHIIIIVVCERLYHDRPTSNSNHQCENTIIIIIITFSIVYKCVDAQIQCYFYHSDHYTASVFILFSFIHIIWSINNLFCSHSVLKSQLVLTPKYQYLSVGDALKCYYLRDQYCYAFIVWFLRLINSRYCLRSLLCASYSREHFHQKHRPFITIHSCGGHVIPVKMHSLLSAQGFSRNLVGSPVPYYPYYYYYYCRSFLRVDIKLTYFLWTLTRLTGHDYRITIL